jgi:hypothetical protein
MSGLCHHCALGDLRRLGATANNGSGMTDNNPPKSSYELALERFRKRDEEAGIERRPPTDAQKAAVAEIRAFYLAKIAELEVLHQGQMRSTAEPADRARLEDEYQRARARLTSERDAKVEKARLA